MRLEAPRRWSLMITLLAIVLALFLEAVIVKTVAVDPVWNAGVPRSVIVSAGSDQAAKPVTLRTMVCMLRLAPKATPAPGRPKADARAL